MKNLIQVEGTTVADLMTFFRKIVREEMSPLLDPTYNKNYTVKELALHLGVTELTIHNWIKKGLLKASKIGRRIVIKQSDLDTALSEVKSLKYKRV